VKISGSLLKIGLGLIKEVN